MLKLPTSIEEAGLAEAFSRMFSAGCIVLKDSLTIESAYIRMSVRCGWH